MYIELYRCVCKLWLLRMCVLLDTRLTISAIYFEIVLQSKNVWEIVFNSECFNRDLGNSCFLPMKQHFQHNYMR